MKTLEDVLISRGELERIYKGATALHLWRAVRQDRNSGGVLHPVLSQIKVSRARVREPDVDTFTKDGISWVRSELGKGVSLLDRPDAFPGHGWEYFIIPAGTLIPAGLLITRDHYIDRYAARHYSICPNYDMPVSDYLALLDWLALNAQRRKKELSNG